MQTRETHHVSEATDVASCEWSDLHTAAWLGMLQTYRHLTRDLDAELEARHGLSLSGLELLSRLAAAAERRLRLSALAEQIGLSISGVSRLVDTLEDGGLVERHTCPEDGRAVNAWLTRAGLELVGAAQATHFTGVQRDFFAHLSAGELRTLADVFTRVAPDARAACLS